MLRRQLLSHDDCPREQYGSIGLLARSPRKWTTISASSLYQNSNLYNFPPDRADFWFIGKILIPYQAGDSIWDYDRFLHTLRVSRWKVQEAPIVHEFDVARILRPNHYRIAMAEVVGSKYIVRSKLGIMHKPNEAVLVVEASTMRILDVLWA
jgi:hypothetical protein